MRVLIAGDCPTAKAVRGYLARHDFHLTGHAPDLTVRIEEQPGALRPILSSIPGELEQAILRHLRKQTSSPLEIHTGSGIESNRAVRIVPPANEDERKAVEISVFRALLEISGQREKRPWWQILFPRKTK